MTIFGKFIQNIGKQMIEGGREFVVHRVANYADKVIEKKMEKDPYGGFTVAIENMENEKVRKALREVHNYWKKVKKNEDKFVNELMKIPEEHRDMIFTVVARLWVKCKKNNNFEEIEDFFDALDNNWLQQWLKKPFILAKDLIEDEWPKIDQRINKKLAGTARKMKIAAADKKRKAGYK